MKEALKPRHRLIPETGELVIEQPEVVGQEPLAVELSEEEKKKKAARREARMARRAQREAAWAVVEDSEARPDGQGTELQEPGQAAEEATMDATVDTTVDTTVEATVDTTERAAQDGAGEVVEVDATVASKARDFLKDDETEGQGKTWADSRMSRRQRAAEVVKSRKEMDAAAEEERLQAELEEERLIEAEKQAEEQRRAAERHIMDGIMVADEGEIGEMHVTGAMERQKTEALEAELVEEQVQWGAWLGLGLGAELSDAARWGTCLVA